MTYSEAVEAKGKSFAQDLIGSLTEWRRLFTRLAPAHPSVGYNELTKRPGGAA